MTKYRRIEVNAFRRRVTIVSGEWPRDGFDAAREDLLACGSFAAETPALPALATQTEDGVSLDDTDVCEPVEPDSPEGQLLLIEAVRSWRGVYCRKLARRFLRVTTLSPRTAQTEVVFVSICNRSGDLFAQELCALLERRNEMRPSNNTQNHSRH